MSQLLLSVLRDIAGKIGTATGGSTTTLVDTQRTEADNYWIGMTLLMLSGANAGLSRNISDHEFAATRLTVDRAFPNNIVSTDKYCIVSNSGDLASAINLGNNAEAATDPSAASGTVFSKLRGVGNDLDSIVTTLAAISAAIGVGAVGEAEAGSSDVLVVDASFTEADDYWNGMTIEFTSGANIGIGRRIIDFDNATATFTVYPAFPAAVVAGDDFTITADGIGPLLGDATDARTAGGVAGSVHSKLHALQKDGFQIVSKNIVLGLGAVPVTENLFTVTGEIEAYVFGFVEAAVTSGGALTLELGVTGNTAALIAITAVAQLAINMFWVDTTTAVGVHAIPTRQLISAANILHVIRDFDATAGEITYYVAYRPISADGACVAV